MSGTPPSWQSDPFGHPGTERYWDGSVWTDSTRPTPPAAAPPSSNSTTIILVAVAGFVVLLIIVGAVAFAVSGGSRKKSPAAVATTQTTTAVSVPSILPPLTSGPTTDPEPLGTVPPVTTPSAPSPVGASLPVFDVDHHRFEVTLLGTVDPAKPGNQFVGPDTGTRLVGLQFRITNDGTALINDDINNDAVVVGSDDQDYTAVFSPISGCTNFTDGAFTVSPGDQAVGCAVFQMPTGIRVAKVEFKPSSGFSDNIAQWNVG